MVRGPTIPSFSRDAVVRALRAIASRLGRPLHTADLEDQPRLHAAIRLHFRSLPSALKAAGLPNLPTRPPKWSLARVINELRQVHREGIKISIPGLKKARRGDLADAAAKYAGSFTAARKLAGVPGPRRWSKSRIIAEIRECGARGMSRLPERLESLCTYYFGSVRAARAAAGVPSPHQAWTRDVVVQALRRHAPRGESVKDRKLAWACRRFFGSVPAARRAAGVPLPGWSRKLVIEKVREHARRAGAGLPLQLGRACRRYFGSVSAARVAAGLEPLLKTWSKQTIIAEIRKHVSRGEPLDSRLVAVSHKHFGSLNTARRAAGVPTVNERWSRDAVIAELRLRRGGFDQRLLNRARRHFGSAAAAYAAAGLAPRKPTWTRERIIAELQAGRRYAHLTQAAQRYFGSLREARRAAGCFDARASVRRP